MVPVVGILIGLLAFFVGETGGPENGFTLLRYHNADAKFLGDLVITSVEEGIQILDIEGNVVKHLEDVSASWLYTAEVDDEKCHAVAYSNHNKETCILKLKTLEDFEVLEHRKVLTNYLETAAKICTLTAPPQIAADELPSDPRQSPR